MNPDRQHRTKQSAPRPNDDAYRQRRYRILGGILIHPVMALLFAITGFLFGETIIQVGSHQPKPGLDGALTSLATLFFLHLFSMGLLFVGSSIIGMLIGHWIGKWRIAMNRSANRPVVIDSADRKE